MHNTHLGSHAPPHINQLPMATVPKNFVHYKVLKDLPGDGKMLVVPEESADNLTINATTDFQKYSGKKQAYMYIGYDHNMDMKNDDFVNGLGKEEKMKFDDEIKKKWKNRGHE